MANPGLWIVDPDTGEEQFVLYSELEQEVVQTFIKPIGGFIFPADLFVLSNLPAAPFYVKDWLPKRGKSLLYAPAKAGKSRLCIQLARCVGVGDEFLGIPTVQGRVLYIQFELGEEILQGRLKETGKGYQNVFVGTTFSMKLDLPAGQRQLWDALSAVEPSVLILDPKYKMIVGDENESSEMLPICDFLDSAIEGFGCSVLLVDHTGKDISRRGRGSTVWEDWVDSYIQMEKTSKRGERLKVKINPIFLRHAQLPPEPIEAELADDFEFHVLEKKPSVEQQVEEAVRLAQNFQGWVSPAELFAMQLGSNTAIYNALKSLIEGGKVERTDRGQYRWAGGT